MKHKNARQSGNRRAGQQTEVYMAENAGLFRGFPGETFVFLSELAKNNHQLWFEKNRARFKEFVETPAKLFGQDILGQMRRKYRDTLGLEGKLFRIHRDLRFSKDKTPYKTHLGMLLSEDTKQSCSIPMFYVQIEAKRLWLVTGIKEMGGERLVNYRNAVSDNAKGNRIELVIGALRKNGFAIRSEQCKSVPAGYDPNHKRSELLRNKSLYAERSSPLPKVIHTADFTDYCLDCFSQAKPLYDWLKGV